MNMSENLVFLLIFYLKVCNLELFLFIVYWVLDYIFKWIVICYWLIEESFIFERGSF